MRPSANKTFYKKIFATIWIQTPAFKSSMLSSCSRILTTPQISNLTAIFRSEIVTWTKHKVFSKRTGKALSLMIGRASENRLFTTRLTSVYAKLRLSDLLNAHIANRNWAGPQLSSQGWMSRRELGPNFYFRLSYDLGNIHGIGAPTEIFL